MIDAPPEDVIEEQSLVHAYDADGIYQGPFMATPSQLAEHGLTAGDAPAPDAEAILNAEREAMKCSRLQGRLVLGEDVCAEIDAIADDPETPWAMRQTIQNSVEWSRTSQAMTELGYLLGYSDAEMDALFLQAMQVAE